MLAAAMGDDPSKYTPLMSLAILLLFSSGMAAIALGLLVALLRFRLWEADTVITRSAAYAVVTLIVGVVWAASSDLVKLVITEVMGRESEAGATTVGAIIAAGIFSPTQSAVLGWTRRHFGGPLDQIRDAAKRLKSWGLTEAPQEVATRALAIIDQAVHPNASAIVLDTAMGHELIAAREVTSADDPKLIEKLTLEDEESSVGTLLIGRRSDGNRYNRQELEAIREIIPSLAEALRVARGRFSRESRHAAANGGNGGTPRAAGRRSAEAGLTLVMVRFANAHRAYSLSFTRPLKPCAMTYHSDESLRLAGGLACFTVVKWRFSSATRLLSAPPASTLAT